MNGKGDSPRNLGPKFRENYESINWQRKPQPTAQQQAQATADERPTNQTLRKAASDKADKS